MFTHRVTPELATGRRQRLHRRGAFSFLLCLSCLALPAAAETDPAKSLAAHLDALKDTRSLTASFVCEKRLAQLETPLLSRGQLWIQKGDGKRGGSNDEGAIRFSTTKPYNSDLILAGGKVFVRSQHETEWTKSNQSSRPGLTAVMTQLGGWSTGDAGKLTEHYTITAATDPVPELAGSKPSDKPQLDAYVLTPTNKDLLKAIKKITIAVDKTHHHLHYIEILTQQDDVTRYWFHDVKTNAEIPANTFKPDAAKQSP